MPGSMHIYFCSQSVPPYVQTSRRLKDLTLRMGQQWKRNVKKHLDKDILASEQKNRRLPNQSSETPVPRISIASVA